MPGYLAKQSELKAKGVDEVIIYCVNDGAVMNAWGKTFDARGSMVEFLADTRCELTNALDLKLEPEEMPQPVLGNTRCKRFSLLVEDGIIKVLNVAGGDVPDEETFVEKMLEQC